METALFEEQLRSLDLKLFSHVPSDTTMKDRMSLLALQNACRDVCGTFRYLEIGSHLGGSLQALLVDDRCTSITSIDPHLVNPPDIRAEAPVYPDNSTEKMLEHLRAVPLADLNKLRTVEASTEDLSPADFEQVEICFIDGEHTPEAALRDASFCLELLDDWGAIVFHDRRLVKRGILAFLSQLKWDAPFTAYSLPRLLFVIEIGPPRLIHSNWILTALSDQP